MANTRPDLLLNGLEASLPALDRLDLLFGAMVEDVLGTGDRGARDASGLACLGTGLAVISRLDRLWSRDHNRFFLRRFDARERGLLLVIHGLLVPTSSPLALFGLGHVVIKSPDCDHALLALGQVASVKVLGEDILDRVHTAFPIVGDYVDTEFSAGAVAVPSIQNFSLEDIYLSSPQWPNRLGLFEKIISLRVR